MNTSKVGQGVFESIDYYIHPTAIIEDGVELGPGVRIWHYVHVRSGARIGAGTQIGKSVYVDSDVIIGEHCKIQNFVSVFRGVTLGNDVFVGPSATFTNDLNPRAFGNWALVSTRVRDGASIGANATIVCGTEIGKYSMVGAGSVVVNSVHDYELVVGNPAKMIGYVCICGRHADSVSEKCNHS